LAWKESLGLWFDIPIWIFAIAAAFLLGLSSLTIAALYSFIFLDSQSVKFFSFLAPTSFYGPVPVPSHPKTIFLSPRICSSLSIFYRGYLYSLMISFIHIFLPCVHHASNSSFVSSNLSQSSQIVVFASLAGFLFLRDFSSLFYSFSILLSSVFFKIISLGGILRASRLKGDLSVRINSVSSPSP
jgi:hypothetical protein